MPVSSAFDRELLRRAIEQRDADALTGLFAPDAEYVDVSAATPPSNPTVLRGRDAIAERLRDVCGRDMTHHVEHVLVDGSSVAWAETCRYPDGTRVATQATCDLDADGRIARLSGVTAWDS